MISTPKTALAAEIQYGSGGGTNSDIHLISSAEDLYSLSHNSADWGNSFKLTKDIDLSSVCGEGNSWTPIVTDSMKFTGTFDGDGKFSLSYECGSGNSVVTWKVTSGNEFVEVDKNSGEVP